MDGVESEFPDLYFLVPLLTETYHDLPFVSSTLNLFVFDNTTIIVKIPTKTTETNIFFSLCSRSNKKVRTPHPKGIS